MTKQKQAVASPTQMQAVILLLDPTYIGKQDIGTVIKKQRENLVQSCQDMGFDIFKIIEVSEDGKEFEELADSLDGEDESQKFALVVEDLRRLMRCPQAFITFIEVLHQPLKEKKIYIISDHTTLITERMIELICELTDGSRKITSTQKLLAKRNPRKRNKTHM